MTKVAASEVKNRVWRFLLSSKHGDRMPLTQAEYEALRGRRHRFRAEKWNDIGGLPHISRDPMKAMG